MPYIDVRTFQDRLALINIDEHITKTIATVCNNFAGYTKTDIKNAILARQAQSMVEHPPDTKIKQLVSSKSIKNCRLKVADVTNACTIFGLYLPGLGGRTTREKPVRVEPTYVGIPRQLYALNKNVNLTADVMFVNRVAFLVTFSKKTDSLLPNTYHLERLPN